MIKQGAYAGILDVEGNPFDDVTLLAKPDENLKGTSNNAIIEL